MSHPGVYRFESGGQDVLPTWQQRTTWQVMELTSDERLFADLRDVQRRTNCSDITLHQFLKIFAKHSSQKLQSELKNFDRKARYLAGCNYELLHGCSKCAHVFEAKSKELLCPAINNEGNVCGQPRFNSAGQPYEVLNNLLMILMLLMFELTLCHFRSKFSTFRCANDCGHFSAFQFSENCLNTNTDDVHLATTR